MNKQHVLCPMGHELMPVLMSFSRSSSLAACAARVAAACCCKAGNDTDHGATANLPQTQPLVSQAASLDCWAPGPNSKLVARLLSCARGKDGWAHRPSAICITARLAGTLLPPRLQRPRLCLLLRLLLGLPCLG